ncbi:MAG: HNH endonuclease [Puniceicoccales bacterium]|jgi:hypothetical protein|nr:HNH endonuclease [Puniceicoccales bacterium]
MASGKQWTRNELLIALNLYHKLNFGQFDAHNRAVIDLAKKLGRTPGSVAMKLSNLASLDPVLKLRGISGLKGASHRDREVWDEFHAILPEMVEKSETLLRELFAPEGSVEVIPAKGILRRPPTPTMPTETTTPQKRRLGQDYFRQIVLNNFDGACGVCGLNIRELLVASHILPWASNPAARLDIRNGLCLSRLHDAAFDQGLISFDADLRLILSSRLKNRLSQKSIEQNFIAHEKHSLTLPPQAIPPNEKYLDRHRNEIFQN